MRLLDRICKILRDEEAATAVEYAVMLAMVLLAILGAIGAVGAQHSAMWNTIGTEMQSAGMTTTP